MPSLGCSWTDCAYKTEDVDATLAVQLLTLHTDSHRLAAAQPPPVHAPPVREKIKRPSIEPGSTLERWNYFISRWTRYKRMSELAAGVLAGHLLECCDEELLMDLHRNNGAALDNMDEKHLLDEIKRLAVKTESTIISRVNMRRMTQDHQEDIRHFTARLRGQATLCEYLVECPTCEHGISYADAEIGDQLCAGIADPDIQKDVLGLIDKHPKLEELVVFIEAKEAGKRSQNALGSSAEISKMSQYRREKMRDKVPSTRQTEQKVPTEPPCGWCGEYGHGRRAPKDIRRSQCPAYKTTCQRCGLMGHFGKVCRCKWKKQSTNDNKEEISAVDAPRGFIGGIELAKIDENITMSHAEYNNFNGWISQHSKSHPMITVTIEVSKEDYDHFNFPLPPHTSTGRINRIAVADTGAMTMVAGKELVQSLGLEISDLIPVKTKLTAAGNTKLNILGGLFIKVGGKTLTTRQLCYIQDGDNKVYLSRNACENLGIISTTFPRIGDHSVSEISEKRDSSDRRCTKSDDSKDKCRCPKRAKPPTAPKTIPFSATPENHGKLKEWILNHYAASTFNICENQGLLKMSGPPLEIDIDPSVTPSAVHTPIPVPIHWKDDVKSQLDRDVKLGVIEPVPWGEPVTWCSRMVTVSKHDGSPRRTIDLQSINAASVRQTHHTPSPFHQAMAVPHNTVKTVFDAWNGYHSLAIRDEDRHYTTFITPWGRYRYCSALQGFLASGDAYTRRFDEIIAHLKNKTKCVDDTLLWEKDIEMAFWQACEFLSLCGENGITLNPSKFQFAENTVEFAGFKITPTSVQPSKKYLEAIIDFPTPTDITGVRSWFGLINQSAYAFSATDKMSPFRESLKPGNKFCWDDGMQKLFEESKKEIVNAVQHGVRLFDPMKRTALTTDWSKVGTGFSLVQKHCNCQSQIPSCCEDGWKLVFAGSQFNTKAESNYSPVEGECLAVVKALRKARYFILGCDDLTVVTDHKPLLKVLGNRKLEEIYNPRLLSLKEKTLIYRFKIVHIPGKQNKTPDATSRYPSTPSDKTDISKEDWTDIEQTTFITAMSSLSYMDNIKSVTWDRVREETASDPVMMNLYNLIQSGFDTDDDRVSLELKPYFKFRDNLSTIDGVVIYKNRVVIPPRLRSNILENLHSAHQGITMMNARAESSVFWPGITVDISNVRARCFQCDKIAPSQPNAPPATPIRPEYPFQCLCADYCAKEGTGYLVTVDRYSGWPVVQRVGHGEATSKQLITALKNHCGTYGIPEELSSDGGPQFESRETNQFLDSYGIHHRVSSVAYPHSNCRAELAVKSIKRLLTDNTGPNGALETDKVLRALLQYRNTPDPETGMSPAQIIFGRQIRDFTPVVPGEYRPRDEWRQTLQRREEALSRRHVKCSETLSEHTKRLPPLKVSDTVIIQNQLGNHPRKWNKTGTVVEVKQHDQYMVRVDGSGRATLRNRKFLRKFTPYHQPSQQSSTPSIIKEPYLTKTLSDQKAPKQQSSKDEVETPDTDTSGPHSLVDDVLTPVPQTPVHSSLPAGEKIPLQTQTPKRPVRYTRSPVPNPERPGEHTTPTSRTPKKLMWQSTASPAQSMDQSHWVRRSTRPQNPVDRFGY